MLDELKKLLALKLVSFGLWIYEVNSDMPLDEIDKEFLRQFKKLKEELS